MSSIPTLIAQLDAPTTRKIAISALIDLGPDAVEEVSTAMLGSDNLERKTRCAAAKSYGFWERSGEQGL